LRKLSGMGVNDMVLGWFESYLTDRHQLVKLIECTSDSLEVLYSVPQGTVLGPLSFLLYVNDIVM